MPRKEQYKPVPRIPSEQDRTFIRKVVNGEQRSRAFRESYPDHPKVARYMDIVTKKAEPNSPEERSKLADTIKQMAKDKVQAKYIRARLNNFSDAMEVLASKSVIVANDLLDNARSEKVKADLATEFIRHKVGSPVAKIQAQVDKTVHLTFGEPPSRDDMSDIIEGDIID